MIPVPLDSGDWSVILNDKPWDVKKYMDVKGISTGKVRSSTYSYGIIDDFYNAYHGLAPWDGVCGCYDEMLVSPDKKPENLLYIEDCDKWWSELLRMESMELVRLLKNQLNGIGS